MIDITIKENIRLTYKTYLTKHTNVIVIQISQGKNVVMKRYKGE